MKSAVISVSLDSLVRPLHSSASYQSEMWIRLSSHEFLQPCPFANEGSLFVFGVMDQYGRKHQSIIQRFDPKTGTGINAGKLPLARYDCTCIQTSETIYVMGGYDNSATLKTVFYT